MKKRVTCRIVSVLLSVVMCVSLCAEFGVNAKEMDADIVREDENDKGEEIGQTKNEAENSSEISGNRDEFMVEEEESADTKEQKDTGELGHDGQQEEEIKSQEADGQMDELEEEQEVNALSVAELKNPRIVKDSSMEAGQKVTWDCVWFGSYPQAEVVPSIKNYTAIHKSMLRSGDTIENGSLYNKLRNANGWNKNGDIVIDRNKYRRIKKSDATHSWSDYNWSDSDSYHYFKYEPLKWRVLKVKGNQAFLLADVVLDDQAYNIVDEDITWETSTIRSW